MTDYGHELQFGVFITPGRRPGRRGARAGSSWPTSSGSTSSRFQDHPYQRAFLDTWTLLSFVAAADANVRVAPNVANLPLRPPVVLARSVASLDILSGGRVELGLGAGAFWDAIAADGGRRLTPGQAVDALAEAIEVIRATWDAERRRRPASTASTTGSSARSRARRRRTTSRSGSAPTSRGCCALTGATADGWLPSSGYADLDRAARDERGDRRAPPRRPGGGRPTIRRLFNINGGVRRRRAGSCRAARASGPSSSPS